MVYASYASAFRNPSTDGEPVVFGVSTQNESQYNYLDVTNDGIIVKSNPNQEHIEFWNGVFDLYSAHWQTREFNWNSLAVKVPLMLLATLLLTILSCKSIRIVLRRKRQAMENNHTN